MSTSYTMRMTEGQKELIQEFARAQGVSMSEFMLTSALDVIEDAIDLHDGLEALAEYRANPVSKPHEQLMREMGLA